MGRRVRDTVMATGFGGILSSQLAGDSRVEGRWGLGKGSEYCGVGVGGSKTGRRADGGIIDDHIRGREDADSETIREKTWNWYISDFRTRLKPNAFIILIQTRWHEDDLAGRILPEKYAGESGLITARDGEVWEVVNFPALAVDDDVLGRELGTALWQDWYRSGEHTSELQSQA